MALNNNHSLAVFLFSIYSTTTITTIFNCMQPQIRKVCRF